MAKAFSVIEALAKRAFGSLNAFDSMDQQEQQAQRQQHQYLKPRVKRPETNPSIEGFIQAKIGAKRSSQEMSGVKEASPTKKHCGGDIRQYFAPNENQQWFNPIMPSIAKKDPAKRSKSAQLFREMNQIIKRAEVGLKKRRPQRHCAEKKKQVVDSSDEDSDYEPNVSSASEVSQEDDETLGVSDGDVDDKQQLACLEKTLFYDSNESDDDDISFNPLTCHEVLADEPLEYNSESKVEKSSSDSDSNRELFSDPFLIENQTDPVLGAKARIAERIRKLEKKYPDIRIYGSPNRGVWGCYRQCQLPSEKNVCEVGPATLFAIMDSMKSVHEFSQILDFGFGEKVSIDVATAAMLRGDVYKYVIVYKDDSLGVDDIIRKTGYITGLLRKGGVPCFEFCKTKDVRHQRIQSIPIKNLIGIFCIV